MATGLLAAGAAERPAAGPAPSPAARKSSPEVRRVPLAFVQLPYRPDAERSAVASLLTRTASRLGSKQLSALAESVSSDPFAKVKGMVQDLIDRLKQEEVNDANHQTWCVEATRAALEDQITNLKAQLKDSRTALSHAQALRDREAAENSRLLSESADGKAAVEDAISVLTSFYDAAAAVEGNETVAAPADAPSAGFDGVSHGSQSESVGIIGMMEVVRDDFERTISETTESEAAAVREFTVLKRELEAGITSKDEALTAAESEHTSTVDDISTGMTEITDGQGLLDAAVKSIVELDASCKAGGTDGGDGSALTAEDRESKRAAEIAALEEALCIFGECPNEETPPLEDETKIDPKNELSPSIAAKLGVTGLKEKLGGFLQKP